MGFILVCMWILFSEEMFVLEEAKAREGMRKREREKMRLLLGDFNEYR